MDMSKVDRRSMLKASLAGGVAATLAAPLRAADRPLHGTSILVTGASSGFGYLGALHYARLGATVIASMRNLPRPEARALLAVAKDEKLSLHVLEIDVTSDAQVAKGVSAAERIAAGPLDVLINNAGIGYAGPIELQDMAATQLIFDTNVYGPHRMARAVLPAMRQAKRGLIVNISSQLGRVIAPSAGHYSPTNFALEAMSEAMAYQFVPHNVEVSIVQPGGYPTNVWKNRNVLARALKDRLSPEAAAAYPALVARMGAEDSSGRTADPMDVPRAIAEIIALPAGSRPLRRAVHPGAKPQEAINRVSAETQLNWLGNSAFGPWIKAVHDG